MYDQGSLKPHQINYLLLVFIAMQIIFLTAGIAAIINQLNKSDEIDRNDPTNQPHISIEDFSQKITNFPSTKEDYIQNSLLEITSVNNPDINLRDVKAEIREGSIHEHYFALPNLNYTSAIIDIPELSQSYQVFLQSSDDKYNKYLDPNGTIIFLCITDPLNIIYLDFNCTDIYSQETRKSIVSRFLPFFKFNQFRSGVDGENYSQVIIAPNDFSQVNEELFITETKQAIQSLGISSGLFDYRIMQAEEYDFRIDQ